MILNEAGIDSDMTFYAQWEEDESILQEIEDLQGTEKIKNPDTGDNIMLFVGIGIVSLIGIIGVSIYLMKKNRKRAK